jgi:hypothetical protein
MYGELSTKLVPTVVCERLQRIASKIESSVQDAGDFVNVKGAADWIRSVAQGNTSRMRILSENAAVLDMLEESLQTYSDPSKGRYLWPVWFGQLSIDSFVTGTRLRNTARVVITAPMQYPSFIPGSSLVTNHTPCAVLRCEPRNIVPIPPWGRIEGIDAEDQDVLRPVLQRLETWGQVGVPVGYNTDPLDIRIVTNGQAQQLTERVFRPRTSWVLDTPEPSLVCCWQDDSAELSDNREYVSYIIEMLKARSRLRKVKEPPYREYAPAQALR